MWRLTQEKLEDVTINCTACKRITMTYATLDLPAKLTLKQACENAGVQDLRKVTIGDTVMYASPDNSVRLVRVRTERDIKRIAKTSREIKRRGK